MNGYELTKAWYDFAYLNPRKIRPIHHALIFWIFECCNQSRWSEEFQLSTQESCVILGISNKHTFLNALKDLVEFGAIRIIQESTGRSTSRWVSLQNCKIYHVEKLHIEEETRKQEKIESSVVPEFVLNELKQITPYTSEGPPLEEIEASMRNSQMLLEAGIRKNQITESEYYKYLEDFFLETRATDKKVKSESDHKKHFLAWLRIQIQNKPKGNTSGKMKTGFDEMSRALNRLENDETYE